VGISLRPHRYSTTIITETGEFAINIPSADIAYEVDLCGTLSGRDADKSRISGLTELPASVIRAPLLAECPVNMECQTRQVIPLGSHVLFLAEVVALHIEEDLLTRVENSEEEADADEDERYLEMKGTRPLLYFPESHDYWTPGNDARPLNHSSGKKP
ncbi:MAG: flavin reductase family protein, partial [Chloroflexi bacterium]|nr:flavin reductase family protein [Chloroflexota bacterium]